MKLLIDIGNSRLKWAVSNDAHDIMLGSALTNESVSARLLAEQWQVLENPSHVVIAHVAASQLAEMAVQAASQRWPDCPIISAKSSAHAFNLTNGYTAPEKLGVDRWLAMLAAYRSYPAGFCLADCGTAITIDVVAADGKHLGGMISPGFGLMKKALAIGTENLTLASADFPIGLANQTAAGIFNGTLAAACGLIERAHRCYAQSFPLLLTGGDAAMIAEQLAIPVIIEPELVFLGLSLYEPPI